MGVKLAKWMLSAKIVLSCLLLLPEGWAGWIPTVSSIEAIRTVGMFLLAFVLLFGPNLIPPIERLLRFSGWGLALTLAILSLITHVTGHNASMAWRVLASATSILLIIGLINPAVLKRFLKAGEKS